MLRIKDIQREPIAIISDDLTGANEIGLVLAEHLESHLVLNSATPTVGLDSLIEDYAGAVVNLNTRDCPGQTAGRLLSDVLQNNPQLRRRLIYKKIDSTLRGNLVEELEAILDHGLADLIYFVPASPRAHRFTVGGYHLVGNQPVALTEYAGGLAVAGTSYLPDLLGRRPKYKVRLISLRQLAAGGHNVKQATMELYQAGGRILVCDACSQSDLGVIRDAVLASPLKVLPVGSAALFEEFFTLGPGLYNDPCMVVCGSLNRQARIQAQKLIDSQTAVGIQIDLDRALSQQRESEIDRVVQLAAACYKEKRNLLIQTPAAAFATDSKAGATLPDSLPSAIGRLTAVIVAGLLENIRISGLILTGGSIAAQIISQLGGKGIILDKELTPLVPVGRLAGGPFDGLRVVTKGGGVGDADTLVRAVNYLRCNR
jgi:uncharacterized protein YgbK (DUF1537 family)